MPQITPGKTSNPIDRNAATPYRIRRNWQRITQGAATQTLSVDGVNIIINGEGQLDLGHPLVVNEIPSGSVNNVNTTFLLQMPPFANTLILMVNGLTQISGSGNDYVLTGNQIVFETGSIPQTGDWLRATYEA